MKFAFFKQKVMTVISRQVHLCIWFKIYEETEALGPVVLDMGALNCQLWLAFQKIH